MKTPRKRVLKSMEHQVREECGQACANPKCREWSTATHELHHIDDDRSNTVKDNLILLCADCHAKQKVGIFSESDVRIWKRMAEAGYLPPPKGQIANPSLSMRDNFGIAAEKVNIENLKMGRSPNRARRENTPGLIEADGDMRTYANYLVGRYIKWRKEGVRIDRRPFSPSGAHGILAEGFGSPTSVLLIPQSRFHNWVEQAQFKINNTTFGRINLSKGKRNYHSWAEHLAERHGTVGVRSTSTAPAFAKDASSA